MEPRSNLARLSRPCAHASSAVTRYVLLTAFALGMAASASPARAQSDLGAGELRGARPFAPSALTSDAPGEGRGRAGAPGADGQRPAFALEPDLSALGRGAPDGTSSDGPPPASQLSVERPIDPNLYVCGPGDVLEVRFWGQQNFRLALTIDLEGRAFIAKVGFVDLAGKSLTDARALVQRSVRQQYPGLTFDVSLLKPRTFLVHVVENVERPGMYEAHPLERVSRVLDRAGAKGSRRRIAIRHADGTSATADLLLYERTGETRYNPFVLDGDVITVPPAELVVSVAGPVRHPGKYELVASRDLAELFALAGGFESWVAKSLPIQLIRRDARQRAESRYLSFSSTGEPPNQPLFDDDVVRVRSTTELQRTILLFAPVEGADTMDDATATKRLPYIEGDTVRTLIERAGGIKAPGDLRHAYISRPREDGTRELVAIDLEALLVRRDFDADRPVQMGDEIVVPPMRRGVLVQGAVARAGVYPYNPQFGVPEFIAHAGGLTRNARRMHSVQVIQPTGKTLRYSDGMKLEPGDAILVPERNYGRGEIISLVIAGAGLLLSGVTLALVVSQ